MGSDSIDFARLRLVPVAATANQQHFATDLKSIESDPIDSPRPNFVATAMGSLEIGAVTDVSIGPASPPTRGKGYPYREPRP